MAWQIAARLGRWEGQDRRHVERSRTRARWLRWLNLPPTFQNIWAMYYLVVVAVKESWTGTGLLGALGMLPLDPSVLARPTPAKVSAGAHQSQPHCVFRSSTHVPPKQLCTTRTHTTCHHLLPCIATMPITSLTKALQTSPSPTAIVADRRLPPAPAPAPRLPMLLLLILLILLLPSHPTHYSSV